MCSIEQGAFAVASPHPPTRPDHEQGGHLHEVTVLGATGTAGRSALPVLSAAGHQERAHARTDESSGELSRGARRGRAMIVGAPDAWTSAIHTDDVGSALFTALTAPVGVYNVVDDDPLHRQDVLAVLAAAAGVPRVDPLPTWIARTAAAPVRALARSQRVTAARFRERGWRPTVPSRRQGWPQASQRAERSAAVGGR